VIRAVVQHAYLFNLMLRLRECTTNLTVLIKNWGIVVIEALRYMSKGLGIDPHWCRWEIFPKLQAETYALRLNQILKMSTRKTPGVKTAGA
jgi:hypothetical protein